MVKITLDFKFCFLLLCLLVYTFLWGVYLQSKYNISAISIPDNYIYTFLGVIIGLMVMRLYYCWFKEGDIQ